MAAPIDYINIAELGVTSGTAWKTKYPTLTVSFITVTEYLNLHTDMRTNAVKTKQLNADRKQATDILKAIHKLIGKHLYNLKGYIIDEFGKENAIRLYDQYGIIHKGKKYAFPSDNDDCGRSLDMVVAELSKPAHPLANKKYGLDFWIVQRDAQRAAWATNKTMDGERSMLTATLQSQKKEAVKLQARLRTHLRAAFGDSYKSVWRDFGFQNEKNK